MNPNDVPTPTAEATTCFTCGKEIPYGQWFARLPHESRRVIFCRPRCMELFLQQQENAPGEPLLGWASTG